MSQSNPPGPAKGSGGRDIKFVALVVLAIVALLSLAVAGYTALTPHTVTVTQQQLLTNTQNVTAVQTQTLTYASTWTSVQTITNTFPAGGQYGSYYPGYGNYYQGCGYYGCYQYPGYGNYPGYYYNYPGYYYGNPGYYNGYPNYGYYYGAYQPCQSTGSYNNVTCSGYLYQANNGCTLLVIPTANNPYPSYATTGVYEYYTLHNLPSNAPSYGAWITVNGLLYEGYNTASNGASCPENYINVNSIT